MSENGCCCAACPCFPNAASRRVSLRQYMHADVHGDRKKRTSGYEIMSEFEVFVKL